jgi:hypothetical protein
MPKHHHPDGDKKHPPKPPHKDKEPKRPEKDRHDDKRSEKHCDFDEFGGLSLDEVLFDLIESVADEEKALALLIRAEADKIQAFIGKNCEFPTKPSNKEILELNRSVTQMLETIVMKEWLLLKKLEKTLEVIREECEDEC